MNGSWRLICEVDGRERVVAIDRGGSPPVGVLIAILVDPVDGFRPTET